MSFLTNMNHLYDIIYDEYPDSLNKLFDHFLRIIQMFNINIAIYLNLLSFASITEWKNIVKHI